MVVAIIGAYLHGAIIFAPGCIALAFRVDALTMPAASTRARSCRCHRVRLLLGAVLPFKLGAAFAVTGRGSGGRRVDLLAVSGTDAIDAQGLDARIRRLHNHVVVELVHRVSAGERLPAQGTAVLAVSGHRPLAGCQVQDVEIFQSALLLSIFQARVDIQLSVFDKRDVSTAFAGGIPRRFHLFPGLQCARGEDPDVVIAGLADHRTATEHDELFVSGFRRPTSRTMSTALVRADSTFRHLAPC